MEARFRVIIALLTIVVLVLLVGYKLFFGMDWLSFFYAVLIVIVAFAILDFFLGE